MTSQMKLSSQACRLLSNLVHGVTQICGHSFGYSQGLDPKDASDTLPRETLQENGAS